ncbi:hypothetical protein A361_15560 [Cytobacillus oceanisediminis 2691]|uniref:Uncharacterized protein n=1 Tax=Cytobacillus oceanisediminis 2691 TaxID=1196031 RepID=A0A161IYB7_9BACI|nr:hypothetical protein A361_15560 [Cytobacillus oceanisediminis 2691]
MPGIASRLLPGKLAKAMIKIFKQTIIVIFLYEGISLQLAFIYFMLICCCFWRIDVLVNNPGKPYESIHKGEIVNK